MWILFVRKYTFYAETVFDVIYDNNTKRCRTYWNDIPKTVEKFISEAQTKKQIDKFHGEEIIYTKGE